MKSMKSNENNEKQALLYFHIITLADSWFFSFFFLTIFCFLSCSFLTNCCCFISFFFLLSVFYFFCFFLYQPFNSYNVIWDEVKNLFMKNLKVETIFLSSCICARWWQYYYNSRKCQADQGKSLREWECTFQCNNNEKNSKIPKTCLQS